MHPALETQIVHRSAEFARRQAAGPASKHFRQDRGGSALFLRVTHSTRWDKQSHGCGLHVLHLFDDYQQAIRQTKTVNRLRHRIQRT